MFLKIDTVDGEAQDNKHKKEIDVLSWSWGMSNAGSAHAGGGAGAGKVNVQDLTFTKWVDKATPKLALACCSGQHFKDATLVVRKDQDGCGVCRFHLHGRLGRRGSAHGKRHAQFFQSKFGLHSARRQGSTRDSYTDGLGYRFEH